MSDISEKDLALLSTIIYCDAFLQRDGADLQSVVADLLKPRGLSNVDFCGDFGHLESSSDRVAAEERFREMLLQVQESDSLKNMKIVMPVLRDGVGITAATFVNTTDDTATVVFRGTDGSYKQWYDNFEGAGNDEFTPMQEIALQYMKDLAALEYDDVTVTGHSKGGNLAMFVTLFSPIVSRCLNFDGQGFSEYLVDKYEDEIKANRGKIKTIAAYNDFVNIIMTSIAGEIVYVNNNNENFFERHYISNLVRDGFDEDGDLITRPQEDAMKIVKVGLDAMLKLLPPEAEEWFTDTFAPLVSLYLGKDDVTFDDILHTLKNLFSGITTASLSPNKIKAILVVVISTVLVTALALFFDWAIDKLIEFTNAVMDRIKQLANKIGQWAVEVANHIKEIVKNFWKWVSGIRNKPGRDYAASNPYFKVDTDKLRNYAMRLKNVNNRLQRLDNDLDSLYWQVGFLDLVDILSVNLSISKNKALKKAITYLEDAATAFDSADDEAYTNMGGA